MLLPKHYGDLAAKLLRTQLPFDDFRRVAQRAHARSSEPIAS